MQLTMLISGKAIMRKKILYPILILSLAVFAVYFSGKAFFRIDLTSEKKYSLSDDSKMILRNLEDIVYLRVYLDGEMPNDLISFKKSVEEFIQELKAYGGSKIAYEFINLYDEANTEVRNTKMRELTEKGLRITDVQLRDEEGGVSTKIIIPGAIISYRDVEFPVNFLKNNPALPYQENLRNSLETLEYEFMRAIKSITSNKIEKIAFIEGHNELDFYETYDISSELSLFFQVDRGQLTGALSQVMDYSALIVAGPETPFSEAEKFILDQYLLHGGRLLFFIDPVEANEDSLIRGRTFTRYRDLNIYDLLFTYGVRISYNLIKDIQCNYKRVQTSVNNQEPVTRVYPWWYSPVFTAHKDHILTRGLNYIKGEYVSSIDTTSAVIEGQERTVLLSSSDTSARIVNPVYISMSEVTRPPDRGVFNKSRLPVAILAEGNFNSFYKNYGIPEGADPGGIPVLDKGNGALFVAGDADLIRNDVLLNNQSPIPQPLGYDRNTRQTFGNKDFIMNLVNYMTGDKSLIQLRSREYKIRLLDRARLRAKSERLKWTLVNSLIPPVVVIVFGVFHNYRRRKKYHITPKEKG